MNRQDYNRKYYLANKHLYEAYRRATSEHRNARRRELHRTCAEYRMNAKTKSKDYRERNPSQRYAAVYGVDAERIELLKDRGCSVCGAGWAPSINVTMHLDHDHFTGKFRGVLCDSCNLGIGKFYNDPALLVAAASYLQERAL